MGKLDSRVAIVTGAGQGMGRAVALEFGKEGAKVVVADMAVETGEQTVEMITNAGGEATFVKTDVSKSEDVKKMVKIAVEKYGKLNIVYNNAGILGEAALTADATEENWYKVIAVNLIGTWLGMKYAIPEMLKIGGGSIINVGSAGGQISQRNLASYCASKNAVAGLSRTAAMEYATKNIRVNVIRPGIIATPMVQGFDEETKAKFRAVVPQNRFGKPSEVAKVAVFLASDDSSHLTGISLPVDGGLLADSGY